MENFDSCLNLCLRDILFGINFTNGNFSDISCDLRIVGKFRIREIRKIWSTPKVTHISYIREIPRNIGFCTTRSSFGLHRSLNTNDLNINIQIIINPIALISLNNKKDMSTSI